MTAAELGAADDDYPRRCARQFMFDGWYFARSWAADVGRFIDGLEGTTVIGIVEADTGKAWGLLYTSDRVWFNNHLVTEWAVAAPGARAMTAAPAISAATPAISVPPDPHALARVLMMRDVDAEAWLAELVARPAWHAEAACHGTGPDPWFPTRQRGRPPAELLALCGTCPVHAECAEAAATERHGWWAGRPAARARRSASVSRPDSEARHP